MRKYIKWLLLFIAYFFAISGKAGALKNAGLIVWALAFVACVLFSVYDKEREE